MGASMSSTYIGWAVVLAVGGSFFAYYRRTGARPVQGRAVKPRQAITSAKKEPKESKPKRQRIEETQRPSYAAMLQSQPPQQGRAYSSDDDADTDNREFARQLSNLKQGTKFTAKTKDETKQKSVKQSRAQELPDAGGETKVSAPSSTAGIDADDDQSSAASPVVGAAEAGGVSDMLEEAASGPSVLRLTNTEDKKNNIAKKPKAPEQPVESKRARQHRKKNEAAKLEREEAEKERKAKMEAQRRTAREAEGRAAKDGSGFMAAQAANTAWTGNGVHGKTNGASGANGYVQPLDTFESNAVQTDASRSSAGLDKEEWVDTKYTEEEQMQMFKEQQDEWETVPTKARKPKRKDSVAEDKKNGETTTEATPAALPAQPATKAAPSGKAPKPIRQESSFAALSTDSPAQGVIEWD